MGQSGNRAIAGSVIKSEPSLQCQVHSKQCIGLCIQKACSQPIVICDMCMAAEDSATSHRCSMLSIEEVKESIKVCNNKVDPTAMALKEAIAKHYSDLRQWCQTKLKQQQTKYLNYLEQYFIGKKCSQTQLEIYRQAKLFNLDSISKSDRHELPSVLKMLNSKCKQINPEQLQAIFNQIQPFDKTVLAQTIRFPSLSTQLDKLLGLSRPVLKPAINYSLNEIKSVILQTKEEQQKFLTIFNSNLGRFKRLGMLFRASENKFDAEKFREMCKDTPNTVTLVRSKKGQIFGGYTPCIWRKVSDNEYTSDHKGQSFLFSVTNLKVYGIRKDMLDTAIQNSSDTGPIFGEGHDFILSNKCNQYVFSHSNLGKTYQCPHPHNSEEAGTELVTQSYFFVEDYEVWSLTQ